MIREKSASRNGRTQWVGSEHDGKPMSLSLFTRAEGKPGYRYGLSRGVVQVGEFPALSHGMLINGLLEAIAVYEQRNPKVINFVGTAAISKLTLWNRESERHPDLSVYLSAPPKGVEQPWDRWVPEIVIEVVSASSIKRDYEEKPGDYLAAGVREYWIIDPMKKAGLFLTRRGDGWTENRVGRRGTWTTPLMPKFKLDLGRLFARVAKQS